MKYTGKELRNKIEEYFDNTPRIEQTTAGMCVFLGIASTTWKTWKSGAYDDKDPEIREACEWGATRMEEKWELDLSKRANPTGPIFALKQHGWRDNQDVEVKGTGSINIVTNIPRPKEG